MAVYVDDMHLTEMGKLGRMKMCHMVADTFDELHEMAEWPENRALDTAWHNNGFSICRSMHTFARTYNKCVLGILYTELI